MLDETYYEFGTSNSVSSFLNDYIHRNGTQMPTSTFQLRQRIMNAGWYLPDTTLGNFIGSNCGYALAAAITTPFDVVKTRR